MGERAVCRLITKSIRLLTNQTSTIAPCGVPGPRAMGKERSPGRSHSSPRTSLSTLLSIPRLLHLYPRAVLFSHIDSNLTSGSIGAPFIDIGPIGEHTEKRTSDLTGVHIFL